jgi:CubicO group peptidase (beta-lactamase class C family)
MGTPGIRLKSRQRGRTMRHPSNPISANVPHHGQAANLHIRAAHARHGIARAMRSWRLAAGTVCFLFALCPLDVDAQQAVIITGEPAPGLGAFDGVMRSMMDGPFGDIPNAALAMTYRGRLVFAHGYTLGGTQPQTQPQSLFRIASVSKQITSTLINRLIQEGRLSLDDTLGEFVSLAPPPGQTADPRLASITVRNLLEHLAGLGVQGTIGFDPMFHDASIAQALGISLPIDRADIIEFMNGVPLASNPGTTYNYSNYGYLLLGRIIESVTGMPYEDYAASVLNPLGICDLHQGHSLPQDRLPGEVPYHSGFTSPTVMDTSGATVPLEYGGFHIENMDSHGGWVTSVVGLARFLSVLDFPNAQTALLDASSLERMFGLPENYPLPYTAGDSYYAKGWAVRNYGGGLRNTWHDGSLPSTTAYVLRTEYGWDYALLLNRRDENDSAAVSNWIDQHMWTAFNQITQWPTGNQFATASPVVFHSSFDGGPTDGCHSGGAQAVSDPSFEETTGNDSPNPYWQSHDTNANGIGGTVFYNATWNHFTTWTGDWLAWFGGWQNGLQEDQYFAQVVTLPRSGSLYLNYRRYAPVSSSVHAYMIVTIDGTTVQSTDMNAMLDAAYVQQSIDIHAYADGAAHEIRFSYSFGGNGQSDGSMFIDNVTVDQSAQASPGF